MSLDLNTCHQDCFSCIKAYKSKHSLKKGQEFEVRCGGIPKEYVSVELSEKDRIAARSILDPVTWAAETLDWHCIDPDGEIWKRKNPDEYYTWKEENPDKSILGCSRYHRPYQATMLRCSSKRKVFRIGRQCLTGDSEVVLSTGERKKITDIQPFDKILSMNQSSLRIEEDVVVDKWYSGKKKVFQIKTKFGKSIICSEDHPFFIIQQRLDNINGITLDRAKKEWLSINTGLSIGDKIAVPYKIKNTINHEVDNNLALLLGYFLSDGSCSKKQSAKFTNNEILYKKEFEELCQYFGTKCNWYSKNKGHDLIITNGNKKNPLREKLKSLGLVNITGPDKFVPDCLLNAPDNIVISFLNRFWAGDGYISTFKRKGRNSYRTEIGTLQESLLLIKQIQELFLRFGIHGYVKKEGNCYRLVVSNRLSVQNFLYYIGDIPKKEPQSKIANQNLSKISDCFTNITNDVLWDYVSSITEIGVENTYDLQTTNNHNFIANNIITHNSGKTECLVISILYNLYVKPGVNEDEGFKVIIITPYQAQIDLIFTRIKQLIKGSPIAQNSIRRDVKAPIYTLELHNNSIARGFSCVAGTKIVTKDGLVNIEEITTKDIVLSKNQYNQLDYMPVSYVYAPNYKDVYKVTLFSGHEVVVSEDHPFWTNKEQWKKLKDLHINDRVAIANDYKMGIGKPDDLGYLLGLILGDGSITQKTMKNGGPRFTASNPLIQKNFEDVLNRLGIAWRDQIHGKTGSKEYTIYKRQQLPKIRPQDRPYTIFTKLLIDYDLIGCTSKNKFIPDDLFNQSPEFRIGLLKGLLETDGFLQSDGSAGFCSISKSLAFGVRDLFNSIGVKATIRIKKQAGKKIKINTEQRFIYCKHNLYEVNVKSTVYTKRLLEIIDLSSKKTFEQCCTKIQNTKQTKSEEIDFSKIRSIEYMGKETTYDISIGDGTNNFIANGILLHNTAGTKSGGNAEAVRGQTGHMLVFDEADYLSSGDMDAAMSIITNYPNATLWMSSTPSGKRERFYSTCLSRRFKEYHFPSQVNPMWNKHLEADFREQLTEIGYRHEIIADFGEQEEGVFQNVYVQAAKADYNYGDIPHYHTWTYSLGVDWNDTANGTTINVLGFNPAKNKFIIVDRKVVSREGWTQTAAMQKITELNRIWRPMAIYIDAGHGGTQYEMLRKFGFDSLIDPKKGPTHPDSRLRDIVTKYDFGSKVETRDPFTKQRINKPAKPFLVESTVRRFEARDIEFSEYDVALENQLLGYIVDRVTQSGVPVYKAGNETAGDHALDALMLSVLAFVMEVSPIGNPKFEMGITFSGQFGQKIDPDIHEGDTVIYANSPKEDNKYQRNRTKPDGDRDKMVPDRLIGKDTDLPATHTNYENQVGLWSWPGFMRDAPKPKVRSIDEATDEAKRRIGLSPKRGSRPKRNNI